MWFINKKGILERCGKNEKDVRWLDRAIKKWLVIHDLDMGYITSGDYIEELELRVEDLKRWKKSEVVESSNSKEVDELKERLGYVRMRNKQLKECIDSIKKTYNEKLHWTDEQFYKKVWYKSDDREVIEEKWASENWII